MSLPQDPERRKPISRRLRYEILRRDNNTCRYCHATDTPLVIDHVIPVALGGTDDPSNLCAACKDCNAGKTSTSPDATTVAQVSDDAIRWSKAMQLASDHALAAKAMAEEELKPWFNEWYVWSGPGRSYDLPMDADKKLSEFIARGLPITSLIEAARIACRARWIDNRFGYFIGVANNMLAELQERARLLIDGGAV